MLRIKELRKEKGLTLRELSQKVGVTDSALSQFENGKKHPKGKTLINLALALDTTVEYLLEQTNDPTRKIASEVDYELIERLKTVTPEEKRLVLAFLEWLSTIREG